MLITQTPLRISFAGGGTDLEEFYRHEDGKVISCTIDKYVFVIIKERFDNKIILNYSQKEIVDSVDEIKHELIREAMRKTEIGNGVEISTLADVPSEGSGLGSSSSLIVGLLNTFYQYQGEQVTPDRLAKEACEIEIDICKKPIGKQDQYIAAFGGIRAFTFKKDGTVEVEKVTINDSDWRRFGSNLLLFYTNTTRKSADILTEQRAKTCDQLEMLREMKGFVDKVREAILSTTFPEVGKNMHLGWELKKRLASRITNPKIDEIYQRALKTGALGGKISGAGGGGFLLLYVPRELQDKVRHALRDLYELPFLLERDGSKVIFNFRRYPAK
jgi:D-glycero-alpha-D-manno-heptose-7-phosphate kinase